MSKKTRYNFIKQKHKEYLILFYEKEHYYSYDLDQILLEKFETLEELEKHNIS